MSIKNTLTADPNFNLEDCLQRVNTIEPIDKILRKNLDPAGLPKYYSKIGFFFKLLHSKEGCMHLPIVSGENEKHDYKLLYQARYIVALIQKHQYKTVVELGCGFAFNSIYLAQQLPDVQFTATDITETNLKTAAARAKKLGLTNIRFELLNFEQDEHNYKADLVFGIETLCYSQDLTLLFKRVAKGLNNNGRMVIFDGYINLPEEYGTLTPAQIKCSRIFSIGYHTKRTQSVEEIYTGIKENALILEAEEDYSSRVYSNTKAFQKGSLRLIKYPLLIKWLIKAGIIPYVVFQQAYEGLFLAYLFEIRFLCYRSFVITKETVTA